MTRTWLVLAVSVAFSACVSNAPESSKSSDQMASEAAQYNLELGVGYLRKGELQMALDKLKKAVEQDPSLADAHMALGFLYEQIDQPGNAEKHMRKAAKLAPDDPQVLNAFAVMQCQHGSTDEALKTFSRAASIPLNRSPEAAYTNAGVCARDGGMLDEADQYFRKALAKNPSYDEALLQLASLNFERQDYFSARAFIERFLQGNKATAEALMLGVRIERAMANTSVGNDYAARLLREFPDSPEARQLLEQRRNGN